MTINIKHLTNGTFYIIMECFKKILLRFSNINWCPVTKHQFWLSFAMSNNDLMRGRLYNNFRGRKKE